MNDQAHNLRQFVRDNRNRARVLAVTSGKGGVGKTSTSVNLSIALAARGARVILLDADLGLANVEVLLGLNSLYNLQHVIAGEKGMNDILVQGPGGIHVVPGSSGLAKLADLGPRARQNILKGLDDLQRNADFVIVDTMAGIGQNAVAFCAAADEVIMVSTPEPSSIVDAYAMIKTIYQMHNDAMFRLVVNMVASPEQAAAVAHKLSYVSQQYLGRSLDMLGSIVRDPHVSRGVMQTYPFSLRYPNAPATRCIEQVAARIIDREAEMNSQRTSFFRRFAQSFGLKTSA